MKIKISYSFLSRIIFWFLYATNLIANLEKPITANDINICSKALAEVFQLINNKAYFSINFNQAMNKALDSFVHCDDYSHFLGPKDYKDLLKSTKGQFYGIGVAIAPKRIEDDYLLVLKVLPDSPAQKKEIQKYDKIIAINGQPVGPLSIEEAILKLRSERRYDPVKLDILRNTKNLLTIKLERDIIKERNITSYYVANKQVLYCSISNFTSDLVSKLSNDLKRAYKQSIKGLILDLRDNPGGVLESAIECASLFLKKNSLVVVTKNKHNQVVDFSSTKKDPVIKEPLPIIILVNNFTASAAEILAGALQDHASQPNTLNPNIFLLGTETYGKSFVQEVIPLSNDCALKITTCLYHLPSGRSINKIGIQPDFTVKQKYSAPKEIELINKLYGKGKNNLDSQKKIDKKNNKWEEQQKENLKEDYQIKCALNLIDLIILGKKIKTLALNDRKKTKDFLLNYSCWCSNLEISELD